MTTHESCFRHGGDEQVVESDDDLEAGVAGKERGQHVNYSQRPPLRIADRPIASGELRRPSLAAFAHNAQSVG